jgi:hypothetical protein
MIKADGTTEKYKMYVMGAGNIYDGHRLSWKNGYYAVGIMSWVTNTGNVSPTRLLLTPQNGNINGVLKNNASAKETVTFGVTLLCVKNSLFI